MEQGYAKPRTVGRWGWGIRVKKKGGGRGIMGFVGKGLGSATAINGTCAQNS